LASAVSVKKKQTKEKHLTVFRAREIATQPDWIERAIAAITKVFSPLTWTD